MKKSTLLTLALTGSLLAALSFAADTKKAAPAATKAAPAPAAAPAAPQQQKLVRVATLKSVEANREFQNNVQLLQAQRQQAVELGTALEKEPNAAKKKELKTKVDELMAKLNENNEKMVKAYGFSLNRNYSMIVETSHIYMFVSDEEAAKLEKEQAAAEAAAKKK
jgi:hypothetical protein